MNRGGDFSTIYKRNHFVESWKASRAGTALEKGAENLFRPPAIFSEGSARFARWIQ
jgi:hypothetical protein